MVTVPALPSIVTIFLSAIEPPLIRNASLPSGQVEMYPQKGARPLSLARF